MSTPAADALHTHLNETTGPVCLERAFRAIQRERMTDIPLLNDALGVEAIGFRPWQGRTLGVLLTPWFMSLVLLPGEHERWHETAVGERRQWRFPAGRYEFICAWHAAIGGYQSCSLFSPVLEFASHEEARAVALAALDALLDAQTGERITAAIAERASDNADVETLSLSGSRQRVRRQLSRRDLLRGALFHDRGESSRD